MKHFDKPFITLLVLIAFLILAIYSREDGYSKQERAGMDKLVESLISPKIAGVLFKPKNEQERASAIADVWFLEKGKPVELILADGRLQ